MPKIIPISELETVCFFVPQRFLIEDKVNCCFS